MPQPQPPVCPPVFPPVCPPVFNVACIVQRGRLEAEALVFARSFRDANPGFTGRLLMAEPAQNDLWPETPTITAPVRAALIQMGVEIIPFENRVFGAAYPQGNKIEALPALPPAPFVFFDTDTLFTGPLGDVAFDFTRPSASMRRTATWPIPPLYGPGYTDIWQSLYARFGLDFESSLDLTQYDDYWERYLYFNAGWFFGADPQAFGARFLDYARSIRFDTPEALACQPLYPWLDQIALPLVIHALGGGRPGPGLAGLDGPISCHYRMLPLLYARENDAVVATLERICAAPELRPLLAGHDAFQQLVFDGHGADIRALFDRTDLPRHEWLIHHAIRERGLWLR